MDITTGDEFHAEDSGLTVHFDESYHIRIRHPEIGLLTAVHGSADDVSVVGSQLIINESGDRNGTRTVLKSTSDR